MSRRAALLLLLLVGAAGCPATVEGGPDLAQTPLRCVPGEVRGCTCLGGGVGTQSCQSDGRRYASCAGCPTGTTSDQGEAPPPILTDGFEPAGTPCGDCDGCCNDAACVPTASQSKSACGKKGDACAACAAGEVCLQGTCVVDTGTCSALSCSDGCCSANVCARADKQSWSLCGSGGQTCQACAYGVQCNGACTDDIDPAATAFYIRVKYLAVTQESWDYLSGPDLLVCFGDGSQIGCARPCGDDRYACTPGAIAGRIVDATGQNVAFTGAQLRKGLPIAVWDEDSPDGNDLIGNGTLPITKKQAAYSTGQFVSVTQLTFEIY